MQKESLLCATNRDSFNRIETLNDTNSRISKYTVRKRCVDCSKIRCIHLIAKKSETGNRKQIGTRSGNSLRQGRCNMFRINRKISHGKAICSLLRRNHVSPSEISISTESSCQYSLIDPYDMIISENPRFQHEDKLLPKRKRKVSELQSNGIKELKSTKMQKKISENTDLFEYTEDHEFSINSDSHFNHSFNNTVEYLYPNIYQTFGQTAADISDRMKYEGKTDYSRSGEKEDIYKIEACANFLSSPFDQEQAVNRSMSIKDEICTASLYSKGDYNLNDLESAETVLYKFLLQSNCSMQIFSAFCTHFSGKKTTQQFQEFFDFFKLFPTKTMLLGYVFLLKFSWFPEFVRIKTQLELLQMYATTCIVAWKSQEDMHVSDGCLVHRMMSMSQFKYYEALFLNSIRYDMKIQENEIKQVVKCIEECNCCWRNWSCNRKNIK